MSKDQKLHEMGRRKATPNSTSTTKKTTSQVPKHVKKPTQKSNKPRLENDAPAHLKASLGNEGKCEESCASSTGAAAQLGQVVHEKNMLPLQNLNSDTESNDSAVSKVATEDHRHLSRSPASRPKRSASSDKSPIKQTNPVVSPSNLASNKSRTTSLSPRLSPKESKSSAVKHMTSSHSKIPYQESKLAPASEKSTLSEDNTRGNKSDESIISCSKPFRNIFSPIPPEHVCDEGHETYDKLQTQQNPVWNENSDSSSDAFNGFPSIKVEDCDETQIASGFRGHRTMKKSATIVGDISFEKYDKKEMNDQQNMTSLNVPSPYIKWRTADGRVIAAMNDDIPVTSPLSRILSRSEGSIPLTFINDASGACGEGSADSREYQTQTTSRKLNRHISNDVPLQSSQPSRNTSLKSISNQKRLITPILNTELKSKQKLHAQTKRKEFAGQTSSRGN